jgi:hypothetical protein
MATTILNFSSYCNYEISETGLRIINWPYPIPNLDVLNPDEAKKLAIAILAQDFNILSDHLSIILDKQLIHEILHQAQSIQKLGLGLNNDQTIKVLEQLIQSRLFDQDGALDAEIVGEPLANIVNQALDHQPQIPAPTEISLDTLVTQAYNQYLKSKKAQEELAKIKQQKNLNQSISQFIQELNKVLNPQIFGQLENLCFLPVDRLEGCLEVFLECVIWKLIQAKFTYCRATFQIEMTSIVVNHVWKISVIQESLTGQEAGEYRDSFEVYGSGLETELLITMGEVRERLEAYLQKTSEQNLQPC